MKTLVWSWCWTDPVSPGRVKAAFREEFYHRQGDRRNGGMIRQLRKSWVDADAIARNGPSVSGARIT
jgi:hypothetical protein